MASSRQVEHPIKLFVAYSRQDSELRAKLAAHLAPLRSLQIIEDCYDGDIPPGTEWRPYIESALVQSDIILLLVSSDFLNSKFCQYETEVALRRRKSASVIPIIVRPCKWEFHPLDELQALPRSGRAATEWPNLDSALKEIASGVFDAVTERVNRGKTAAIFPARQSNALLLDRLSRATEVHKLCNRDSQEQALFDFCKEVMPAKPGMPMIILVPGFEADRPDFLVDRLCHKVLPKLISQTGARNRVSVFGPLADDDRMVCDTLEQLQRRRALKLYERLDCIDRLDIAKPSALPLADLERLRRYPFVAIRHDLHLSGIRDRIMEFIRWYSGEFWAGMKNLNGPQFVVFLNLLLPENRPVQTFRRLLIWRPASADSLGHPWLADRLRTLFPKNSRRAWCDPGSAACATLWMPELECLDASHVDDWLSKLNRYIGLTQIELFDSVEARKQKAEELFVLAPRDAAGQVRMDGLSVALTQFRERFGVEGAA